MKNHTLLLAPLLLAACATPRESCIDLATKDLVTVRALIADTEATIERGYAIQTEQRLVAYTDFCIGAHRNVGVTFCNRVQPVTSKKPVAVDLNEERRKLRSLRQKKSELERRTRRQVADCKAQYPDA